MKQNRTAAAACTNMIEVRAGVDDVDRELAALIGERFRYMDAAARIKPDRADVRDEVRKAEVIANARFNAIRHDWPPELAEILWDRLIEESIAHELVRWDAIRT